MRVFLASLNYFTVMQEAFHVLKGAEIHLATVQQMMALGHGYAVCITGPLWGETTAQFWIAIAKGQ